MEDDDDIGLSPPEVPASLGRGAIADRTLPSGGAVHCGLRSRPQSGGCRRMRIPTQLHGYVQRLPQPLGCGPLLLSGMSSAHTGKARTAEKTCCPIKVGRKGCFRPPAEKERRAALGSSVGAPFMMQRVLRFAEIWFEPIPEPRHSDWLNLQPEHMQTFDAFKRAFARYQSQMGPTTDRRCVHLLPLGTDESLACLLPQLRDICTGFFWPLRVALLRPQSLSHCECPNGSLDAASVLDWMKPRLRADSVLLIGLSMAALTIDGVATVGASDWDCRIAVLSSNECQTAPELHLCTTEKGRSSEFLERFTKFVLHQTTHMFGILHCCYYRCLMNGSSCVEEADTKPPYLCGICLKKLHLVLGFDVLDRYMRLAAAWTKAGCEDIGRWYETRVASVCSVLAGCQPTAFRAGPPAHVPRRETAAGASFADPEQPAEIAACDRSGIARRGSATQDLPGSECSSCPPSGRPASRGLGGQGKLSKNWCQKKDCSRPSTCQRWSGGSSRTSGTQHSEEPEATQLMRLGSGVAGS